MRTTSMMVRKSRVELVIYCGGGLDVLGPTTYVGVVLGEEGFGGAEGTGAVGKGAGIEDART